MENLFYYYGFIYIISKLIIIFQKNDNTVHLEPTNISDGQNYVSKKKYTLLILLLNMVWIIIGIINTEEYMYFISLILLTGVFILLSLERDGMNFQIGRKKSIQIIDNVCSIIMVGFIIYHHFFIN